MKIQVKCKNKVVKTILNICALGWFVGIGVIILMDAKPKEFWMFFAVVVPAMFFLVWSLVPKIGAEIVNSIEIEGDDLYIKKFLKEKRVINVYEIKKYTTFRKKMHKGPRRECIHVYYDDTFIELYEDNVCNYEVLLDYLVQKRCLRDYGE